MWAWPATSRPSKNRRASLGPLHALDSDMEGRLVCLSGRLHTARGLEAQSAPVVSMTLVDASGVVITHRADEVTLLGSEPVVLLGRIAVAVGSVERHTDGGQRGQWRILLDGDHVRARGILRRVSALRGGYRDNCTRWALCATGPTNAIDTAFDGSWITSAWRRFTV